MRGKKVKQHLVKPDSKYQSVTVAKLINTLMNGGKKSVARTIVYKAFDLLKEETKQDPLGVFNKAVKQIAPTVEVRSRRVGGSNYQIPYQVKGNRKMTLVYRWLISAARSTKGKPMHVALKEEIILATKNEGGAVKKRVDVEKMAVANRAFAHFAD